MLTSIQAELNAVFAQIEEDCHLKSGHLSEFIPGFQLNPIDVYLRPTLVLLSAKLFQGCLKKPAVLAGVVQLIFIAQEIHNRIPDDCAKEAPQFPVLVGDYLFSKFFKKLSDHNLLEWLAPLASVICEMNEGGVVRHEVLDRGLAGEEACLEVIRREHGLLSALACKIGSSVAGAAKEKAEALEQFGLKLGMAWGIIKEKRHLSPVGLLNEAKDSLAKVPFGPERDLMLELVDQIREMALPHPGTAPVEKSAAAY
ncbi:polyprenyl synthetase family protein [Candidatus Formimonas warabiya]|uniref:Polyprenyl synthetase family protein n=1 Tax=Formimonas warabiya TaxID=1761012 RepID=A0A3G1KPY5_FORW1|nr:polyprenyl synthetase family protein [Candidatus Formimonas warabiya]ATW24524.1 hypothetical protein DCMF_06785 [Candidatus Formimonas warabiya]